MQMQIVEDDIRTRGNTSHDSSEPFLSTIKEHLSPKEVTARRLDVLKTYHSWLSAQEKEIELSDKLISVKAKLSKLDPEVRTPELVSLKNEEYTLTVDKNRAAWQIKKIAEQITKSNPFGLHPRGRTDTNIGESFAQLELMELIRADMEKRDRGALNESKTLLAMGFLAESRESLARYASSFKDTSQVNSKELADSILMIQSELNIGDAHVAERNADSLYSRLPKINTSLNENNRKLFKAYCRSISADSFNDLKLQVLTRSDILSTEFTSALLSREKFDPKENPSLHQMQKRLWDIEGPWGDKNYTHEEDIQLLNTSYAIKKRMQVLREAYENNLNEIESLSSLEDKSGLRQEASQNLWSLYHDTEKLLDTQINSRVFSKVGSFVSIEGQEQTRMDSLFLVAALSKYMNRNDEDTYLSKLHNNEPTHLPTSARVYSLLEDALSNGEISISDHILEDITSLGTSDQSPEEIFEALNEKYGTQFEEAFDIYTEMKKEIEPYNAFSILLNSTTSESKGLGFNQHQFNSAETAWSNDMLPLREFEEKLKVLMTRLNCNSEAVPEILNSFVEANGRSKEVVRYADNFKRKFSIDKN